MLDIRLTVSGDPLHEWQDSLRAIGRAFPDDDRPFLNRMADVLEREHTASFERGYRVPDRPWQETDPYWAEKMRGKPGRKPLVWTGKAKQSISTRVRGRNVEVRGEDYLGKFQRGTDNFQQYGKVPMVGEFVAMDGEPPTHSQRITRHERHIFDVTQTDADEAMMLTGLQAGMAGAEARWSRVI